MARKGIIIIPSEIIEINGIEEFIPCVVIEGEKGYRLLDWHWGNDFEIAQKIADDYNAKLEITKEEVQKLTFDSMEFN